MTGVQMAKSTEHFLTLDGLRGIAATAVVAHHGERLLWPSIERAHPWLAVDFFFCLSGFVIAHAYAGRLATAMSVTTFLKIRLRRLAPLFLLGMGLGLAVALLQSSIGSPENRIAARETLVGIVGFFGLPAPPIYGLERPLYPLNDPAWSMLFEMLINVTFALIWRTGGGSRQHLIGWLLCAAAALIAVNTVWDRLEWGWNWSSIVVGLARVAWSFPLGVLLYDLYRSGWLQRISVPPPLLMLVTMAMLVVPTPPVSKSYELATLFVLIPIIVLLAANSRSGPALSRIEGWLGASSYALYITHYPIFLIYGVIVSRIAHTSPDTLAPWAGIGLLAFAHAFAFSAYRMYDLPVRRWLARRDKPSAPSERQTYA